MKTIITLFILVTAFTVKAQHVEIHSNTTTIALVNTTTGKTYLGFYGLPKSSETVGFSSSTINPTNVVDFSGDLELNFRLDSTTATTEYDSLAGYVIPLNHEGRPKADTLWFDWANFTTAPDSAIYTAWVPASSPSYNARPDFSINLTGKLEPCFGVEVGFIQKAVSHSSLVTLNTSEVR